VRGLWWYGRQQQRREVCAVQRKGLAETIREAVGNKKPIKWSLRPEVLLCPNTPQPMHGVVPREILGSRWWNATRQAAYESTAFHCVACGVSKYQAKAHQWLEGHEIYKADYQQGLWTYIETVPLCHYCHNYIHDGRLLWLLQRGQITQGRYVSILQHGDRVLEAAGLFRLSHAERDKLILAANAEGLIAPWGKWRLILNGRRYPPKFRTYAAWVKATKKEELRDHA
jgi:hypothetical protein